MAKKIKKPSISVIICHHAGDLIHRCLDSVYASKNSDFEVIVVTSDKTLTTPWAACRLIYAQDGPAHKRNVGVSQSKGEYLVFLDDDVEVSPFCLYELKKGLEDRPKAGIGFAKIYNMERRTEFDDCGSWITWTGFLYARANGHQFDSGQYDDPCKILASKSATCIIRRVVFIKAGGFDQDYYILGEETDVCWRVVLQGPEVWYLPAAHSWHAFGTSLKPPEKYYTKDRIHRLGSRNYTKLLMTNLGVLRLSFILPIHVSIWVFSAIGFMATGQWSRGYLILAGLWDALVGLPRTLWKRKKVQGSRKISDRELMKIVMHNPPLIYYWDRISTYLKRGLHG